MSDFPRGWTLSNYAVPPSITVPAIAGVVHVLDAITAKILAGAAGSQWAVQVVLSSSDGVFASLVLALLQVPAASSEDEASASGLDLAAGPGASLTITFANIAGAGAGDVAALVIQGHDI